MVEMKPKTAKHKMTAILKRNEALMREDFERRYVYNALEIESAVSLARG